MSVRLISLVSLLLLACGPEPSADSVGSTDAIESTGADEPTGGQTEPTGGQTEPASLGDACRLLFVRRVDYDQRCTGTSFPPEDAQPFVDSCVGFATAPGALLEIADITACADQLAGACLFGATYPDCVGYGPDMLYPNHDHHGSAPPGAACFAQVQCDSGYCSGFVDECGQCQRLRALGESCGEASDLCVGASCIAGICEIFGLHEGETCADYGGGDCQSTLYCHSEGDILMGVCTARGQPGDACTPELECAGDLYCDVSVCITPLADGAPCVGRPGACESRYCLDGVCGRPKAGLDVGGDCSSDDCRYDLICQDDVCQTYHVIEEGGVCGDSSLAACMVGLYCDIVCEQEGCDNPGVCHVPPGVGEHCGFLGQCATGATCVDPGLDDQHNQTGVCQTYGAAGDPCPCGDLLACVNGQCTPYGAALCE